MSDRGEGGFDRIAGAYALPMLGGEVEECHEFSSVFLQGQRRFGVFGLVGFDEQIEGLLRIAFGLSLPNVVDGGLGFWLRQLWQAIEHVHRLVLPATLVAGRGIDLIHGSPEPHGTVSDSQFGGIHPLAFEPEQNLAPALSRLAYTVLDRQEAFLATGRDPNNHKGAELVIFAAKTAVDAVCPDIDDRLVIKRSVFPAIVFLSLIALEPRDRIC